MMRRGAMMKRSVAVAVAVALLSLSVLWFVQRQDDPAASPAATASAAVARPRRVEFGAPPSRRIDLSRAERTAEEGVGRIEGEVLSRHDDRRIAHARLSFSSGALHAVTADERGRFVFSPPREGVYELALVEADGFLPFAPELGHSPMIFVARVGAGLRGARIHLSPASDYTVRVLSPDGAPQPGATVRIVGGRAAGTSLTADAPQVVTDGHGEALLSAPDEAVLEGRHDDHGPGRARVDFSAQVSHLITIVLTSRDEMVRSDAALVGTVTATGAPWPDALVVARFEAKNPALRDAELVPTMRALTDDDGRFAFDGLTHGRYTLIASAPGFAPTVVRQVTVPGDEVAIALTTGVGISGKVKDLTTGAPIVSFAVVVQERRGPLRTELVAVEPTFDTVRRPVRG